jgi:hypothetical protein
MSGSVCGRVVDRAVAISVSQKSTTAIHASGTPADSRVTMSKDQDSQPFLD